MEWEDGKETAQEMSYDISWACNMFFFPTSPLALPHLKHEMEGFFLAGVWLIH